MTSHQLGILGVITVLLATGIAILGVFPFVVMVVCAAGVAGVCCSLHRTYTRRSATPKQTEPQPDEAKEPRGAALEGGINMVNSPPVEGVNTDAASPKTAATDDFPWRDTSFPKDIKLSKFLLYLSDRILPRDIDKVKFLLEDHTQMKAGILQCPGTSHLAPEYILKPKSFEERHG